MEGPFGETCKLCLRYIQGVELVAVDDNVSSQLGFLQLNLERSVEESNAICLECKGKIEEAFNFKTCIVPSVNRGTVKISATDTPSTSTGIVESAAERVPCHLCHSIVVSSSVISFPKVLKDDSILDIFRQHIPEVGLKDIEDKMVCSSCQNSLGNFSMLVSSWSIANEWNDEDIKEGFNFDDETRIKDENLQECESDSNTNTSMGVIDSIDSATKNPDEKFQGNEQTVEIKTERDASSPSEFVSVNSQNIKQEDKNQVKDVEMDGIQLKDEEIDIKDEEGRKSFSSNYKKYLESLKNMKPVTIDDGSSVFKCEKCSFMSKKLRGLMNHSVKHNKPRELRLYGCKICDYKSKHRGSQYRHMLSHKDPKDRAIYKCLQCSFTTYYKQSILDHKLTHKDITEVKLFKCELCSFDTKYKNSLKVHKRLIHNVETVTDKKYCSKPKKPVEDGPTSYKCEHCPYEAKSSVGLTHHTLVHKREIVPPTLYICKICKYKTKKRDFFARHELMHSNPEQCEIFQCPDCPYTTLYKQFLKSHAIVHKDPSEILMYRCDECSYESRFKAHFALHKKRQHSGPLISQSKEKRFACDNCDYRTNKKNSLQKHMITHKSAEEAEYFKCEECPYQSKYKSALTRHVVTHRTLDEVVTYQCTECSIRTKTKINMEKHMLVHQRAADPKLLKCKYCSYSTRIRMVLNTHTKRAHGDEPENNEENLKVNIKDEVISADDQEKSASEHFIMETISKI